MEKDGKVQKAIGFSNSHREEFLEDLQELVSIPSESTSPEHKGDVVRAAEWLARRLEAYGADATEIIATPGHPVVWAQFSARNADAPVLLVYGHYDVQPVDPIDLWETDPFVPTMKGERLYGRGASDMKAQVLATVEAVRSYTATAGLPITVRFMLEGEEEIGSPSLADVIRGHAERFRADVCLNPDTGMLGPDTPALRYGLRGLAYFELAVRGPERDLHSGSFGGVVHNPAQVIAEVVAGMHDAEGHVTLRGFYDRVRQIDEKEIARLAAVPYGETDVRGLTGVPALWGEPGFTVTERTTARPTLEINGIWGGYTGHGSKTVIPAEARAKISMRLVPDQRPKEIRAMLEAYLAERVPPTVRWELQEFADGNPFICDPESPPHQAFVAAAREVWGVDPVLSRSGGSVPVAADVEELLGVPSVLTGFALPDDRIHSPNESQHIPTWYRGIEACIRFFDTLAESGV